MPEEGAEPETKGQIPTNLRLLRVLEEVARIGTPVSPGALAEALEVPKPTMHRLLATAEEQAVTLRLAAVGRALAGVSGPGTEAQRRRLARLRGWKAEGLAGIGRQLLGVSVPDFRLRFNPAESLTI